MRIRQLAKFGLVAASAWGTLVTLSCGDNPAPAESHSDNGGGAGSASGSAGKANAGGTTHSGGTAGIGGRTANGGQAPQAGNGQGGEAPQGGADAAGGDASGGTPPTVDCSALPAKPTGIEPVSGARGYHGIVFDAAGNLIGVHDGTIY